MVVKQIGGKLGLILTRGGKFVNNIFYICTVINSVYLVSDSFLNKYQILSK
jgi:hypothetical protein